MVDEMCEIEEMLINNDDFTTFLEGQMLAIKTIISTENDFDDYSPSKSSNEGPQIQYDSSAYKSCKTIIEEAESNETSRITSSVMKVELKQEINQEDRYERRVETSPRKTNTPQFLIGSKSSFSSISTHKLPESGIRYSDLKFKKSVFVPKSIYKNNKYCEWLNFDISEKNFSSKKSFETGNRVKRRRKESEFASRQWSKNNGLSSLSLSKSFNYESLKKSEANDNQCQFIYSNIFQTDYEGASNRKIENEVDIDEDYDNISIPFECSIPHRELEAFLKETYTKDLVISEADNEDVKSYETFSPNLKNSRPHCSSQKDINTEFLNQPKTLVKKENCGNCKL